tara:strand:+ start:567 stop:809 length:243 start_codon:yes stop_codon:yes gene_type:complete
MNKPLHYLISFLHDKTRPEYSSLSTAIFCGLTAGANVAHDAGIGLVPIFFAVITLACAATTFSACVQATTSTTLQAANKE